MDKSPLLTSGWPRNKFFIEQTQRDYMGLALANCNFEDIIVLSDADEIWRPDLVSRFENRGDSFGFRSARMQMYLYYYNLLYIHRMHGAVIMTYEHLVFNLDGSLGAARQNRRSNRLITNGGWHFSCIGGYEEAARRLETNSHSDRDNKRVWERMQENIDKDRFYAAGESNRGKGALKTTVVPFDDTFPRYMRENQSKYEEYIRKVGF
jgi:beta-1,4-mannosyl-glycoprotein beta-1,4-N-acetylglucosaminyltransferase